MTDSRWIDPEIDGILEDDPELSQLAHLIRASRPEPALDPRFKAVLRAQLMREAATIAAPALAETKRRVPSRSGAHRMWWRRPTPFAFAGAGLGLALAAAAVVSILRPIQDHQVVTAGSPVAELHQVSPDNVITVAFSQPMNQQAVVAGLHIRPATQVTTAWQGNNLLITPTHRLAGNTPYTVTIDRTAAKAANGAVADADIHISFGTAPTPAPAPTVVTLKTTALGPVDAGTHLIAGPSGSVIATSSTAPFTIPTPPVSTTPSSTPSSAPPAAAASPASVSRSVLFGSSGTTDLGPAVSSTALSADGLRLISAVTGATGNQIVLSPVSGGKSTVLTTIGVPVLATGWLSPDTALVAESDRILSIDLQGHVTNLVSLPTGTTNVVFAPLGGHAFAGAAGADGTLFDLATMQGRALPGSRTLAAFSGNGTTVAWVDSSRPIAQLVTSPVAHEQATDIPLDHPGDNVADLALDQTGARVAIIDHPAAGGDELDINALPSGTLIARGPSSTNPVFSSSGNRIGLVSGGQAETAVLPGAAPAGTTTALPDGAAAVLQAFVDAQTSGDAAAISALTVPSLPAAQLTPHGLTRAYVISAAVNQNGAVAATARLIIDASVTHPLASFADETLTLTPSTGKTSFQVSNIAVAPLHDEPVGPHVVHVTPTNVAGVLVLQVSFDSDLRPSTVAAAISVTGSDGQALQTTTVYDAERRTAVVTLTVPANTPVSVTVDSVLLDVDGQALAGVFTAAVGG